MELHLYRIVNGQLIHLQHVVPGVLGVVGMKYSPRPGASLLEWAVATCQYMADFYSRHGVSVQHVIAVQLGWTTEYVYV